MLLTGRAGHTKNCPGSAALIDEVIESRMIFKRVSELLQEVGNTFVSCQPNENIQEECEELQQGIRKANASNAELGFSIHFNKAYESYEGKLGNECWVYSKDYFKANNTAKNICANLSNLGFLGYKNKPRGVKVNPNLYELKHSVMDWIIIEVCFVEARKDVELYKRLGVERVARAIANGIDPRVSLEGDNIILELQKLFNKYNLVDEKGELLKEDGKYSINLIQSLNKLEKILIKEATRESDK